MVFPNDAVQTVDEIYKIIGMAVGTFIVMAFVFVGVLLHEARKLEKKPLGKNSTIAR